MSPHAPAWKRESTRWGFSSTDFDNDGRPDLFVTGVTAPFLMRRTRFSLPPAASPGGTPRGDALAEEIRRRFRSEDRGLILELARCRVRTPLRAIR
jgi:hypothetical protein